MAALEYARKLHDVSGGKNVTFLGTLATACVEASHFSEAAEALEAAATLSDANGDAAQAAALQQEALRIREKTRTAKEVTHPK